jgi:hypothetical protein
VVGLLQSCVLVFLSVLIVRSTGSTHPEGSTVWQSDRNVCKDSQHTVGQWRPEGQIVGDLMNSEEQVLVRRSSNHVCRSQEAPVKDRGIAEEVRAGQLDRHNEENNPFCQGLRAAELGDLKVKIGVSNAVQERWQGTREPMLLPPQPLAGRLPSQGLQMRTRSWKIPTYLWMGLDNCLSPGTVWLLCIRPKEMVLD